MSSPRLIIFDMDGTLIDSQDFIVEAMHLAFTQAGRSPPERSAVLLIVGLSLPEAMHELIGDISLDEAQSLAAAYKQSFVTLREKCGGERNSPLYPNARNALERIHRHSASIMGVATGKARRGLDHALDAHGLRQYFATCQTADAHPSKPHPSMVREALLDTATEAGSAVMVGDTEFDIAMGRAAGVRTIGVSWGYHPVARLRAAGADAIVDGFSELLDVLEIGAL